MLNAHRNGEGRGEGKRLGEAGAIHGPMPRSPRRLGRIVAAPPESVAHPLCSRLSVAAAGRRTAEVAIRTGVSMASVSRYIRERPPPLSFIAEFCRVFGVSADWLLLGRGPCRLTDVTRWAQESAGAADLFVALGARVEAGDHDALRELGARLGLLPEPRPARGGRRRAGRSRERSRAPKLSGATAGAGESPTAADGDQSFPGSQIEAAQEPSHQDGAAGRAEYPSAEPEDTGPDAVGPGPDATRAG